MPILDDEFEYRHVILPKALVRYLPTDRLADEDEWRGVGIRQSPGWEHYLRHGASNSHQLGPDGSHLARSIAPEPHILLFKREKDYQMT